ncbi:hypothetical protein D9758_014357 [Tetrapyrgos nigripes]|uniref:BTB domain-containing protein n=1 Tax=Tetrapyrgos nigripes TaxID=182062 RepID=A0A8H5C7Z2_9AGAR|nr:hypothetical protein D9758_014357 [Tetrapyrgos nigripes]
MSTVPTRSVDYFWQDQICFKVEDTLFKVPDFHFKNSSKIFRKRFNLQEGDSLEGRNEEKPIALHGVSAFDFEQFLRALIPLLDGDTKYPMDAHEKISLGRKFHVPEWVESGYTQLVKRSKMLTLGEGATIGPDSAMRIFRLREWQRIQLKHHTESYSRRSSRRFLVLTSLTVSQDPDSDIPLSWSLEDAVKEEFKNELKDIRAENISLSDSPDVEVPSEPVTPCSIHTPEYEATVEELFLESFAGDLTRTTSGKSHRSQPY